MAVRLLKDLARFLVALVAAFVLALALLEAGMRLFGQPQLPLGMLRPHPTRQSTLVPGYHGRTYDVPLDIDSHGVRGDERAVDPAALRIVVLGDSLAFGPGVTAADTFAGQLERILVAKGRRVQVFNLSVPGYNTAFEWDLWREQWARLQPDLTVVAFNLTDDTVHATSVGGGRPWVRALKDRLHRSYALQYALARALAVRQSLAAPSRADAPQSRLASLAPLYADGNAGWSECRGVLADMAAFGRAHREPFVFALIGDRGRIARRAEDDDLRPLFEKLAATLDGLGLAYHVDVEDALRDYAGRETELFVRPGDMHLSVEGHRRIATLLAGYLAGRGLLVKREP